jgi:hypothetical protein
VETFLSQSFHVSEIVILVKKNYIKRLLIFNMMFVKIWGKQHCEIAKVVGCRENSKKCIVSFRVLQLCSRL